MTPAAAASISTADEATTMMITTDPLSESVSVSVSVSAVVSTSSVTVFVSGITSVCGASVSVSVDSSLGSQSYFGGCPADVSPPLTIHFRWLYNRLTVKLIGCGDGQRRAALAVFGMIGNFYGYSFLAESIAVL